MIDIEAVRSARVVVATREACPYCKRAKAALKEAGVAFVEVDAAADAELRQAVRDASGRNTVPQIFVGGKSLGGSDDLAAALESGSFQAALADATAQQVPALPEAVLKVVERVAAAHLAASGAAAKEGAQRREAEEALRQVRALLADPQAGIKDRVPKAVRRRRQVVFRGQQLLDWLAALVAAPDASSTSNSARVQTARQWVTQQLSQGGGEGAGGAGSSGGAAAPGQLARVASELLVGGVISPATEELPPAAASPKLEAEGLYQLVSESAPPEKGQPLNTGYWWMGPARPAEQVAESLRGLILQLYDRHLSADGRAVNYKGIRADPLFQEYVQATAELQRVDLSPLGRDELCALFINLYNALIVHALAAHGAPANTLQRSAFFTRDAAYCIAGNTYTADDVENGVLRGNRAPASSLLSLVGLPKLARPQFGTCARKDPRLAKVVQPMDARIHFALVCGAKSCPPISVYTADNLDEGLSAAGEAFCAGEVEVDKARRTVRLSMILKWYSIDFGDNDTEKLRYVLQFLKGQQRADLEALLSGGGPIKVEYKPYDWALNE